MNASSYFYNHNLKTRGGRMEGVITTKQVPDRLAKALVADIERGGNNRIMPYPWQSETCIGQWHYQRSLYEQPGEYGGYAHPREVIHWLIDTVSKNGTFILNIPGRPDGTIDSKEIAVLDGITAWMQVNGEAIHESRPWTVYGEGPDVEKNASHPSSDLGTFTAGDVRFTRNKTNTILYAFVLVRPAGEVVLHSLASAAGAKPVNVQHVEVLGTAERIAWTQNDRGLRVTLPVLANPGEDYATVLKIKLT
jgi:alpha-L-fucosidase